MTSIQIACTMEAAEVTQQLKCHQLSMENEKVVVEVLIHKIEHHDSQRFHVRCGGNPCRFIMAECRECHKKGHIICVCHSKGSQLRIS